MIPKIRETYQRFFRDENEVAEDVARANSQEFIDWYSRGYMQKFLDWLEEKACEPLDESNPTTVIKSAARSNTFREIKRELLKIRGRAESTLRG